jgi:DAACS family dicarboxylate/amino acid:cation (Na+ or H+) symporter
MTTAIVEPKPPRKGLSLPARIAIGLVAGLALGMASRTLISADQQKWLLLNLAKPMGDVFLNMMFLTVIPLVFSSLALGVAGLGDLRTVGRMGGRLLIGTVVLSSLSVFIGIALAQTLRPGDGLDPAARTTLMQTTEGADVDKRLEQAAGSKTMAQVISETVSRNPLEDAVNLFNPAPHYRGGGILSFLFVTILVGIALTTVAPRHAEPILTLLEAIQALCMRIIDFAMKLAPYGVAALVFQASAQIGGGIFSLLGKYVACVLLGLAVHIVVCYSLVLWLAVRRSPLDFFRRVQEVMYTAFSTSSSNATLPTALRIATTRLRLRKPVASFVLTVGATGNQNGTALFEGITVLFLAQFYGIDLSLGAQVTVVLMSILAGVGTAGVPGGSIPLIVLLLQSIGVPAEGIGIILGVDRLLDMSRTVVNVTGDLVLAEVAAGAYPDGPGRVPVNEPTEDFPTMEDSTESVRPNTVE